jgi:hypothetical protein
MISNPAKLMNEIFLITYQIQVKFPELYRLLSETPLYLVESERFITNSDFEKYLETIKNQLAVSENNSNVSLIF